MGCEFKVHLEATNEADIVIAVYDPNDPHSERAAAAVAVAKKLINKQVLSLDLKAIRVREEFTLHRIAKQSIIRYNRLGTISKSQGQANQ